MKETCARRSARGQAGNAVPGLHRVHHQNVFHRFSSFVQAPATVRYKWNLQSPDRPLSWSSRSLFGVLDIAAKYFFSLSEESKLASRFYLPESLAREGEIIEGNRVVEMRDDGIHACDGQQPLCTLETGGTAELRSKECLQLPSATRELEPVESGCIQAISPHVPASPPTFATLRRSTSPSVGARSPCTVPGYGPNEIQWADTTALPQL